MTLVYLYMIFFRIGLFSVGGGLATIPFLQEIVEKYGWITNQDLLDIIAISESTPGPIGINSATFVGYKLAGVVGGIVAVLGIVTPSIIIIIIIAHMLEKFKEAKVVKAGFYGIRPVVAGLIGAAAFEVAKIALLNQDKFAMTGHIIDLFNLKALVICGIALYLIMKFEKHPIVYIIGGAIVGIIIGA